MGIELSDNVFQTVVLTLTALCAVYLALRSGRRSLWLLAFAYGSFALGTLYYVLHLALVGHVPQVFYVSEVSWLASHLFFLSRELLYTDGMRVRFLPVPAILAVLTAAAAIVFDVFGPSIFVKGAFAIVAGSDVYLALQRILTGHGSKKSAACLLFVPLLQILLFAVSAFTRDYTHFGLYYMVDLLLTADIIALLPITCREDTQQ